MRVHPNPAFRVSSALNTVRLDFTLSQDATLFFDVTDASGKSVAKNSSCALKEGQQSIPISLTGLADGTYFVRATAEGSRAVAKFVVTR